MTLDKKIAGFCEKTHYWKAVEDVFFHFLGCKIQKTVYADNCVMLKLISRNQKLNVLLILEYYKDTPSEYQLWKINLELSTPNGTSRIKFNTIDGIQSVPNQYRHLLTELTRALTPISIGE